MFLLFSFVPLSVKDGNKKKICMCTFSALCLYLCVFKMKYCQEKNAWTLNAILPLPNWFLWTSEQEAHHWLANSVLLSLRYLGPCRYNVCLEKLGIVIFISVAECMAAKQWVEYANGAERLTEKKKYYYLLSLHPHRPPVGPPFYRWAQAWTAISVGNVLFTGFEADKHPLWCEFINPLRYWDLREVL